MNRGTDTILHRFTQQTADLKDIFEETAKRMIVGAMAYTHTRMRSDDTQPPGQSQGHGGSFHSQPIQVHPHLFSSIGPSVPTTSSYFRSPEQAELVQTTPGKEHVLGILPTGSGKSLSFFSAPLLDPSGLYIVITPLTALTEDMGRRLDESHGIRGGIYPQFSELDGQLVFAAAHHAGTDVFYNWAEKQVGRLRRIFIDECHHVYLSSSYRPCFRLFHRLTGLGKPFTFLSATVLPDSISLLCEAMGISERTLRVIRASTARPNIRYSVTQVPKHEDMYDVVTTFCRKCNIKPKDRGIIYTRTTADAREVAKRLGCDFYISKVCDDAEANTKEKQGRLERWKRGDNLWIVGTQCLGEGIDQDNIRYVVHYNVTTLIGLAQETGRAGRDGQPAYSYVFWNELPWISSKPSTERPTHEFPGYYDVEAGHTHYGVHELQIYLHEQYQCLRIRLMGALDGKAHSCAALGGTPCANCERVSNVSHKSIVLFIHTYTATGKDPDKHVSRHQF